MPLVAKLQASIRNRLNQNARKWSKERAFNKDYKVSHHRRAQKTVIIRKLFRRLALTSRGTALPEVRPRAKKIILVERVMEMM